MCMEKPIGPLTLFCLNRCAMPPVRALTAPLFWAIIFSRLSVIPETTGQYGVTPQLFTFLLKMVQLRRADMFMFYSLCSLQIISNGWLLYTCSAAGLAFFVVVDINTLKNKCKTKRKHISSRRRIIS